VTLDPPFRRVLVANRGEIALRIIRACHELGCETVAVYSDPDRDAPHVRAATRAVRLGPAPAAESYLALERLLDAARSGGADALHPGYGFLSERPELAEACAAAGIVFVGPAPRALGGLGDKLAARRAATSAGVPVVPGMLEAAPLGNPRAVDAVRREADRIGWPVLVKAAGGGGGRGMREVERPADLPLALEAAAREAQAAFGDASVYLERLIRGGRHIEVQLLGDSAGNVIALGERDCSIQRRHQKLVEEAPAPGLSAQSRRELYTRAVAVAGAVGLTNAATAEFLLDPSGDFWFLEINARLQVEHGITELITGVDLVHEQLRVAAGRPLSDGVRAAAERVVDPDRHAIEVRLGAEDPAREFAPTTGRISVWREPSGPGVRLDSGVEEGMLVGSDYDPLLAKLMVVAEDRAAAVTRLERALAELKIAGLQTTHAFHAWLARSAEFRHGEVTTDFVKRHWRPESLRETLAHRASVLAAHAHIPELGAPSHDRRRTLRDGMQSPAADRADAWRSGARQEAVERWPERDSRAGRVVATRSSERARP
jgi:acetyl/propionyl-CoA carboxylase alpha subunit